MGFELDAFLGKASDLREWRREFPSVVVCQLSGDLGLAPVTDEFFQELSKWYPHPSYPSTSCLDAARSWGAHASRNTTIAYVSAFEFGDDGSEGAILWSNGKEILSGASFVAALHYFRDQAGIRIEEKSIDIEKYRGETAAEKWAAAAILDELVERSEKPIAGLIEALHYERKSITIQNSVRQFAANSLAKLGPTAREALPSLEHSLKSDQNSGIWHSAASALAAIGPEAAPALVSSLSDATYDKKWPIIQALGKLGPAARQAISELVKVLQVPVLNDFLGVRPEAARSLGEIGPEAIEAVPSLIESLKDENWILRSAAAEALGKICLVAGDVASALNNARNDDNQWVREAASRALAKVQDKGGSAKSEHGDR
ncbi:MAG TPA: HEAT repeat domain-containing protein [Blastocatellia bacterium]|nr:HEAT repeat domain-containing protein [Blastocatellia bacterium]